MHYCIDTKGLQKAMIDENIKNPSELAKIAGISRKTSSDVVNGNILPSTVVMQKIAYALHMSGEQAGAIFFATNLRDA